MDMVIPKAKHSIYLNRLPQIHRASNPGAIALYKPSRNHFSLVPTIIPRKLKQSPPSSIAGTLDSRQIRGRKINVPGAGKSIPNSTRKQQ